MQQPLSSVHGSNICTLPRRLLATHPHGARLTFRVSLLAVLSCTKGRANAPLVSRSPPTARARAVSCHYRIHNGLAETAAKIGLSRPWKPPAAISVLARLGATAGDFKECGSVRDRTGFVSGPTLPNPSPAIRRTGQRREAGSSCPSPVFLLTTVIAMTVNTTRRGSKWISAAVLETCTLCVKRVWHRYQGRAKGETANHAFAPYPSVGYLRKNTRLEFRISLGSRFLDIDLRRTMRQSGRVGGSK